MVTSTVHAGRAIEHSLVDRILLDRVVSRAAGDGVDLSVACVDAIVAGAGAQRVAARASYEDVIAAAAGETVGAALTVEAVGAAEAAQLV